MKRTLKTIFAVLLITILTFSIMAPSFAAVSPDKYTGNGATTSTDKIDNMGQNIIKVVSVVGSIISVVVLIALGIKYMMGSAEEKAEYKKTLLPYVIGAAFVFAASTIATVIFNFASTF